MNPFDNCGQSFSLCIFRQVKQSPCWINALLSGTERLFPEAGLTKGGWSGGVGEGKHRLLTEGKVFWKKILLWFGRCRSGAVAFCWEIINWLISSPLPPYPFSYQHIKPGGGHRKFGACTSTSWAKEIIPLFGWLLEHCWKLPHLLMEAEKRKLTK